jgi:hypothetical protein
MNSNPQTEQAKAGVKFTNFTVETDGTAKGTTIKLNGKAVENLSSLYFSWYGGLYSPISLSYSVREKSNPGELHASTSYTLRCPESESAYATRADASADQSAADPQLYFDFSTSSVDPVAQKIEALRAKGTNPWAQLK